MSATVPESTEVRRAALLKRYCTLQSLAVEALNHSFAGDCFCGQGGLSDHWMHQHWRTDDAVVEFIEDAVIKAAAKRLGKTKKEVRAMLVERRQT